MVALAWKLLLNWVQSKENLKRRGVIQGTTQTMCSFCSMYEESTSHLFFTCPQTWRIWNLVNRWLGSTLVMPEEGKAHILMFLDSCFGRDRKSGLGFIWLSTIWYIWTLQKQCDI